MFFILTIKRQSFKIYFITNEIRLKLQSSENYLSIALGNAHSGARNRYHKDHKTFKTMLLGPLDHPDTVLSDDNDYYSVSQLKDLRYSPVLRQKLTLTSNSIQSYHHQMTYALIDEALDLVRNPLVLVYRYILVD